MDTFKGNFEYREPSKEEPPKHVSLFVAEWLLEHGFALNGFGTRRKPDDKHQIYIHGQKPSKRKLFGLIPYQPLRPCLGWIYFDRLRGTDEKTWAFHRLCHEDTYNNLLYELEQHFKVHIFVLDDDYFLTSDG